MLIRCDVELDVAWLGASEGTDVGNGGFVVVGEFQEGECCVLSGCFQHIAECRNGRP